MASARLASDLLLEDVHDIIQAAFGWTDSLLHCFGCGPEYYSHETEYYLCPFEVAEGEAGVPEDEVRLDEVLVEAGDAERLPAGGSEVVRVVRRVERTW